MSSVMTSPLGGAASQTPPPMRRDRVAGGKIWDSALAQKALIEAFIKLDPRVQIKNPVMFVVLVLTGPWTLQLLVDYVTRLIGSIPTLVG